MTNLINPSAKRLDLYQRQFIRASKRLVFEYLTDPHKLKSWLVTEAMMPNRKGEHYFLEWKTGKRCEGKVVSYLQDKKLAIEWSERTIVSFSLSSKNRGTVLRIDHHGYGDDKYWADNFIGHCSGWAYFAMNLKSVIEFGNDLRSDYYGHAP